MPEPPAPLGRWTRWRRRLRSRRVVVRDRSMEPTFRPGDRLLVDPSAYLEHAPQRGDVVVVADPAEPGRWLLKRVVGTPGDRVRTTSGGAERVAAPAGESRPASPRSLEELEVPSAHVFLLSDRPARSRDSRQFGPVPEPTLMGRVWRRYRPRERAEEFSSGQPLSDR